MRKKIKKKPDVNQRKMWVTVSLVGLPWVLLLVAGFLLWNDKLLLADLRKSEIERNNFNVGEEGVAFGNLKPYTITVKGEKRTLNIPDGFRIDILSDEIARPEVLMDSGDELYVTDSENGGVYRFNLDANNELVTVDGGVRKPFGMVKVEEDLFVGDETGVIRYERVARDGSYVTKERIVEGLPRGGRYPEKTLAYKDGRIYVTVAASCEICREKDDRALVLSYDLSGGNEEVYARGVQYSQDLVWFEGQLYSLDIGRPNLGVDIPPGEINVLTKGKDYGWPFCYGDGEVDPKFPDEAARCQDKTEFPEYLLPAHTMPSSLTFTRGTDWEQPFGDSILVAMEGSESKLTPVGYKIVRLRQDDKTLQNFVTGWLETDGSHWGRPSSISIRGRDLFVADSMNGVIYRISIE